MLLSEVQRTESGGVINMGRTLAIKRGQTREKAVGFQEMGIFRCDSCGEEVFIFTIPIPRRTIAELGTSITGAIILPLRQVGRVDVVIPTTPAIPGDEDRGACAQRACADGPDAVAVHCCPGVTTGLGSLRRKDAR
jgi:hypothetical protein